MKNRLFLLFSILFLTIYSGCNEEPQVNANFFASELTVVAGSMVAYTDLSTNNPIGWEWSFEGGTPLSSNEQNPTVLYESVGTFDVSLKATNAGTSDVERKTGYINVVPKLVALFEPNDSIINEAGEITFTDESYGAPTTWQWTFAGGTPSTSSDQNPTIEYSTPGVYDVTLKISNDFEPAGNMITKQIVVLPTSGLMAYYPFDGNAEDHSDNSFDGILMNGVTHSTDRNQEDNKAYNFDGIDDHISTSTEIDQLLGNGFTFSAWIYLDPIEANGFYTILSNYNGNSSTGNCNTRIGIHFRINSDKSMRIFYAWDGDDRYGRDSESGVVQEKKWYNVVAIWNGNVNTSGFKLYLDGVRVDVSDYSEGFFNCGGYLESLDPFRIGINECGGPPAGLCQPFSGKIDEVRIYNRQLSGQEILALSKS